jgi:NAD(P)-dependent dehydrogenase (short-subunit alcohol dehydrogenase family)
MNEMRINAITPIILARKLKQNVLAGEDKKIIFISSQMGSIDDNYSGRFYFYRSSKSALNSAAKSLAIDWKDKNISVLMLHPGWVKTDMGGESAKLEIPDSIQRMIQIISDLNLETSGSFVNYEGNKLEW